MVYPVYIEHHTRETTFAFILQSLVTCYLLELNKILKVNSFHIFKILLQSEESVIHPNIVLIPLEKYIHF